MQVHKAQTQSSHPDAHRPPVPSLPCTTLQNFGFAAAGGKAAFTHSSLMATSFTRRRYWHLQGQRDPGQFLSWPGSLGQDHSVCSSEQLGYPEKRKRLERWRRPQAVSREAEGQRGTEQLLTPAWARRENQNCSMCCWKEGRAVDYAEKLEAGAAGNRM